MESTQDIIRGYLNGGKYQDKALSLSDTEDEYDLDLITDPLDDTSTSVRSEIAFSSPPTPHDSPLKVHFGKLRGSPVKARVSPLKRRVPHNDENLSPTFEDYELTDTHKYLNKVPEFIPSSKEFEKYSLLLASSTDKLVKQLAAERKKNRELETRLANLENEKFRAQVTKSDYDLLKGEYTSLQEKFDLLQGKSRLNEEDHSHLTRENSLLRGKLIKYKKLYEELRDKEAFTLSNNPKFSRTQSAPDFSDVPKEDFVQRPVSSDAKPQSFPGFNEQFHNKPIQSADRGNQTQRLDLDRVQLLLEQFVLLVGRPKESSGSESERAPQHSTILKDHEQILQSSVSPLSSAHQQTEPADVLAALVQNVQQISDDLKHFSELVHPADERGNATVLSNSNKPQSSGGITKHGKHLHEGRQPHAKTVERETPSASGGKCHTHNLPDCDPCIAAYKLTSRPMSQSTSKEATESNTQALMGRYIWNRTI